MSRRLAIHVTRRHVGNVFLGLSVVCLLGMLTIIAINIHDFSVLNQRISSGGH